MLPSKTIFPSIGDSAHSQIEKRQGLVPASTRGITPGTKPKSRTVSAIFNRMYDIYISSRLLKFVAGYQGKSGNHVYAITADTDNDKEEDFNPTRSVIEERLRLWLTEG